ncbi:MAG: M15 family metallopeptidase [Candidatus Brocadiales bacterium]|nr:M15 family metallopeptidase [Candidatus Brocadiales bacterium]
MSLREKQSKFALHFAQLIQYVYEQGYECTIGDVWAHDRHKNNSFHYIKLAGDLNLFLDGKYLTETEDHKFLGEYWESLDPLCTWGGDFSRKDGNHYSYGEFEND